MMLTIQRCDDVEDWYVIERAEHDGREWEEKVRCGTRFCKSSRLCGIGGHSADIEGSAEEMRDVARAIRGRQEESAKRCFVDARREPVLIGSPRNDNGYHGEVTLTEADDLASQIERLLGA